MNQETGQDFVVFLPLAFGLLWLAVTTILAALSGWFTLMSKFPDRPGEPILRVSGQSGSMGLGIGMRRILTLSVCAAGLRVGMLRLFGPFCRDFLVPWDAIRITRTKLLLWRFARLQFGDPVVGSLTLPAHAADRLARAALGRWPENGPFPEEKRRDMLWRLLAQWAFLTVVGALFFTLAPLAVAPSGDRPPLVVAILFPAIVFGAVAVVKYGLARR